MTGGSDYKAWWLCSTCGHKWQASVSNRVTNGSGCPVCARRKLSEARSRPAPGQSLKDLYPELADEWDATRNGDLTSADIHPGTPRKFWWLCPDCGRNLVIRTGRFGRFISCSGFPECAYRRSIVNKTGAGLILDIVLGIIGALVGGWLFTRLGYAGVTGFNIYSMFVAVIGAVIVLLLYHMVFARRW